jgi:hypothetical protein
MNIDAVEVGATSPISTDDEAASSWPSAPNKRQCSSSGKYDGGGAPPMPSTKRHRCECQPPRISEHDEHDVASIVGVATADDDCDDVDDDVSKDDVDDDEEEEDDDDDDDHDDYEASSFELDLSTCPEVGGIGVGMSKLMIADTEGGEMTMGDETQNLAIECAANGFNLFLTGKAGTGKSWTSRRIRTRLGDKQLHVVAPTGVAAINVDGTTVHAWGRFGECRSLGSEFVLTLATPTRAISSPTHVPYTGLGSYYSDFDKMMGSETRKKIRSTDVLLFDEISMCDGHFFDVLECMVAIIRCYNDDLAERIKAIKCQAPVMNENMGGSQPSIMSSFMLKMRWEDPARGGLGDLPPWGGMQLIAVGDFFQLPPVPNRARGAVNGDDRQFLLENDELYEIDYNNQVGTMGTYAFQSRSWSKSNFRTIELTKIHRQSDSDDGFLKLLNAMREGIKPLTPMHSMAINAIEAPICGNLQGIVPTQLHSKNSDVTAINISELDKLVGEPFRFKANDNVKFHYHYKKKLVKKYSLEAIAHLPQVWTSVEGISYPSIHHEKKVELQLSKSKKEALIKARMYNEIKELDDRIDSLEKEISDLETSLKQNSTICLGNVASWLMQADVKEEPQACFDRLTSFDEQLRSDHKKLVSHANERFFARECRVDELTLKERSQVMLLYNLEIPCKLANGSRGVVEGFVETDEYMNLIRAIMKIRDKHTTRVDKGDKNIKVIDGDDKAEEGVALILSGVEKDVIKELVGRLKIMDFINDELAKVERAVAAKMTKLPIVKFLEGQIRVIVPQAFTKEFKGCGEAQRWQLPLTLAWAISIHKR